jgi:hypothetical protein
MLRTISVFFQEHPAIMLGTHGSSRFLPDSWFLSVWLFFTAKFIRFKQGHNSYAIMHAWVRRSWSATDREGTRVLATRVCSRYTSTHAHCAICIDLALIHCKSCTKATSSSVIVRPAALAARIPWWLRSVPAKYRAFRTCLYNIDNSIV